jgi:hypothetical protein
LHAQGFLKRLHGHVQNAFVGIVAQKVLIQKAQRDFLAHRNGAAVGFVLAHEQAQQGRFAGAIEADKADFVLGFDVQAGAVVEGARAEVKV